MRHMACRISMAPVLTGRGLISVMRRAMVAPSSKNSAASVRINRSKATSRGLGPKVGRTAFAKRSIPFCSSREVRGCMITSGRRRTILGGAGRYPGAPGMCDHFIPLMRNPCDLSGEWPNYNTDRLLPRLWTENILPLLHQQLLQKSFGRAQTDD